MCLVSKVAGLLVPAGAFVQPAIPQQCAVINYFVLGVGKLRGDESGIRKGVSSGSGLSAFEETALGADIWEKSWS